MGYTLCDSCRGLEFPRQGESGVTWVPTLCEGGVVRGYGTLIGKGGVIIYPAFISQVYFGILSTV